MWKWLCNWVMSRDWKNFEVHDKESLDCLEKNLGRNMNIKGYSREGSERKGEICRGGFSHLKEYICHHE